MFPSEKQLRKEAKAAESACKRYPDDASNWKKRGMALLQLENYLISVEEYEEAKNCLETAYKLEGPKDTHTLYHLGMAYIGILETRPHVYREDIVFFEKFCMDGIAHFMNVEKQAPGVYMTSVWINMIKQSLSSFQAEWGRTHLFPVEALEKKKAKKKMQGDKPILKEKNHEEKSTKVATTLLESSGSVKSPCERTQTFADALTLLDRVLSILPKDIPAEMPLGRAYDLLLKECRPHQV